MGVNSIVAVNYNTTDVDLTQSRRLSPEESLLNYKELAASVFGEAEETALKYPSLNLKVPDEHGLRGPFPADPQIFDGDVCTNPWETAYIDTLSTGRWMQFCCTFMTNHSPLTNFDFDRPFEEVWNSNFMQWVRQNSIPGSLNPSCAFCRSHNLSDSANNDGRKKAILRGQKLYEKHIGINNVFGDDF